MQLVARVYRRQLILAFFSSLVSLWRISVHTLTDPHPAPFGFREVLVGARAIRHHADTLQSSPRPGETSSAACGLLYFRVGFPAARWKEASSGRDRQVNVNDF